MFRHVRGPSNCWMGVATVVPSLMADGGRIENQSLVEVVSDCLIQCTHDNVLVPANVLHRGPLGVTGDGLDDVDPLPSTQNGS